VNLNPKIKCPECGAYYTFYSHMVGDQSRCPECRSNDTKQEWKQA